MKVANVLQMLKRTAEHLNATINHYISQDYLPKNLARKWKIANKLVYQKVKNQLGGRLRGLVSGGGS